MHLGLDQIPFLPNIKESLGVDHEFMVIVSEESAYGRVERGDDDILLSKN